MHDTIATDHHLSEVIAAINNDVLLRDLAWAHAIRTTHPTHTAPALALHGFAHHTDR